MNTILIAASSSPSDLISLILQLPLRLSLGRHRSSRRLRRRRGGVEQRWHPSIQASPTTVEAPKLETP